MSAGHNDTRNLLLVSSAFPPPMTTAAITAYRLSQHLPDFGWSVTVLTPPGQNKPGEAERKASAPKPNPFDGWLPFGDTIFAVPELVRRGVALCAENRIDAIVSRAGPVAACVAADALARRTGLPVHHILGDPWGPCSLRTPLRPFWTRHLEGWAERRIVDRAASIILNTQTTRDDYLNAFPGLDAARAHVLRSPYDPCPEAETGRVVDGRPSILFPGSISRRVPPQVLFAFARALATRSKGDLPEIKVTASPGEIPADLVQMIRVIPRQPLDRMPEVLRSADILLAISQPTAQRIPLKLSDFLGAEAPVLVLEQAPNPELRAFVTDADMGAVFAVSDMEAAATWASTLLQSARPIRQKRNPDFTQHMTSQAITAQLAAILDA